MVSVANACVLLSTCFVLLIASVYMTRYARMMFVVYVAGLRIVQSAWTRSDDARSLMHPGLMRAILVSISNLAMVMSLMHVCDPAIWMRHRSEHYGLALRLYSCTVHAAWITQLLWLSVVYYAPRKQIMRAVALLSGQIFIVCTYTTDATWIAWTLFIEEERGPLFEIVLLCLIHILHLHIILLSAHSRL